MPQYLRLTCFEYWPNPLRIRISRKKFAPIKKNVLIKGVDDKRQITVTFAVSSTRSLLPTQSIYTGKIRRCLPRYDFPASYSLSFTKIYWSNTEKSYEIFKEIIFLQLKKWKRKKDFQKSNICLLLTVNKAANAIIQNQYNDWFSSQVSHQLKSGKDLVDIKVSSKSSNLKILHTSWIVNLHNHLQGECETIVKGFEEAGIVEAIKNIEAIYEKVKDPFRL